ncbi:MAG TPA: D-aminoacylase [Cyclobacteriaceae bacterium]
MKKTLFVLFLCLSYLPETLAQQYDLIIRNGTIYDGSGGKPYKADVAIKDQKVVAIKSLPKATAKRVIDAKGLAVSPGFIDLHTHIEAVHKTPDAESHVRQGITLALGGPDGGGPWPFGDYLVGLESKPLGLNVAFLTGHNTIRENIMKLDNRAPTAAELEQMKQQVAQAMREGAFGLSTGLKYLPGAFSKVDEVIAVSKVASSMGGFYTSHLREEGLGLIDAVQEAIVIGRDAKIPIVLTHHKVIGKPSWGQSVKTLAMVDSANRAGLDIQIDQYPYTASYTSISVLIPGWSRAGGKDDFQARIDNPVLRDSIKKEIVYNIMTDRGAGDISRIQFSMVPWNRELEGKTLADWCVMKKIATTPENGADLVIEAELNGGSGMIFHAMDDKDVERIMKHPRTMIASDGRLSQPGNGQPHPRAYGTFPRVLGVYVREKKILTLEEAVRKMTELPAQRMGLKDRGSLKTNYFADIVIFDPATVKDKSTFENPHQYPDGIPYVIVNGVVTVDEGVFTANRNGKVLYGPAKNKK